MIENSDGLDDPFSKIDSLWNLENTVNEETLKDWKLDLTLIKEVFYYQDLTNDYRRHFHQLVFH
jgi:hypothetical protein